jgi:ferredoxin--NADP+ reductase
VVFASLFGAGRFKTASIRNIETHERVLSREGSVRPSLDRHAVQLPRHPRHRLPFPERPVRDDRPRSRRPSALARLQHGERQSRGRARVLLDQGSRRPLTSRLQKIKEGDTILVGRKATGTLIADNLIPGKRLLLLSTGTGLAPFASLIKDPDVYDRFETIVLVHGCRQVSELAYGEQLVATLRDDELFGPLLSEKLVYYPTVTREPFRNRGRITDLINSAQLFDDIGQAPLDIEIDRIMMCGGPAMLEELRGMFESRGFTEGSGSKPGHFVIEKAFVER